MAKEKFSLTVLEGQQLLKYANLRLPEKMGAETFDLDQRTTCDDQQRILRANLRAVSPMVSSDRRNCFGPAEFWEKAKEGDSYSIKKDCELKTVEVEIEEDGVYGACWTLFVMMHPGSPAPAGIGEFDEICWPLAKKLGWEGQLKQQLKIDKRRGVTLRRDGEKEKA
jgi:hypothetical protein